MVRSAMDGEGQRAALEALIRDRGASYAALSRLLGRNAAYLQQFVSRGSPRMLGERERAVLARYFGVAESVLGGPERNGLAEILRVDVSASA